MRIHFSNVNFSSSTGPNTFAARLASALHDRGHEIVGQNDPYDVFLCFIEPSSEPRAGSRIVQRLDGIWFKPDEFHIKNKRIKWLYDRAHVVVWQSEFDKKMTEKYWGPRSGRVIHNGIKLSLVDIKDEAIKTIRSRFDRVFVCSASWHRQKRLKENIELYLANRNTNDCLFVLGNNPDYIRKDSNIFYAGLCSHDICLQIYAISDWMIHLAWLDHCPNVVVEALSQKCPVICTNSGGTSEIVGVNGIILKESIDYDYSLLDYDFPFELDTHKQQILLDKIDVNSSGLDINQACNQYEDIMRWD